MSRNWKVGTCRGARAKSVLSELAETSMMLFLFIHHVRRMYSYFIRYRTADVRFIPNLCTYLGGGNAL